MPKFTRVRDVATGHHYDLADSLLDVLLARGAVEVLKDYPVASGAGALPRPSSHFVDKDGAPSTPNHPADPDQPDPAAITESGEPDKSEGEQS